ncbi:LOW QUALITY PROTEIN: methionine ABC transporter permease protein [Geomicrobium sp. JCM 19037]|nr:LOW QUALITY PROTEIN: methionine ABC transporter permease protein [Geomicrobium sp. JCM 19037]
MLEMLPSAIQPNITTAQLLDALYETLYMVSISLVFSVLIGAVLGVILVVTRDGHILSSPFIFNLLNPVINVLRSIPFIILLVAIIPITRAIVGTSVGTTAAIVPLVAYAAPYVARLVENSLLEVEPGILEAADAMGASKVQVITKFILPEAMGSLILTITTVTIGLVGATAMLVRSELEELATLRSHTYQRFDNMTMLITVVLLVLIVQAVQTSGNYFSRKARRR